MKVIYSLLYCLNLIVFYHAMLQEQPLEAGIHVAFLEFGFGFAVLWIAVAVLFPDCFVGPDVYAVGRIELITFRVETKDNSISHIVKY